MDILNNDADRESFCAIFDAAFKCRGDCNIHCSLFAAAWVQVACNSGKGLTIREAFRRWVHSSLSKKERQRVWDKVLGEGK